MSRRSIHAKKIAKLRKHMRATPPARIDLIHWLKLHRHAATSGEARKLLVDGKVKVDSHPIGREQVSIPSVQGDGKEPDTAWVPAPLVDASYRGRISVVTS